MQAGEPAQRMRPILAELAHLPSARQIAAELNGAGSRVPLAANGPQKPSLAYESDLTPLIGKETSRQLTHCAQEAQGP